MPKHRSIPRCLMNATAIRKALTQMARKISRLQQAGAQVMLVGIQTGGVQLARHLAGRLAKAWGRPPPVGELDISMHRDDLDGRLAPPVHPTSIPADVTGKIVVLVDDVLYSGRTIRAAMDALNDFGRPNRILLAVLVDRGHRELPITADFVGLTVKTAPDDRIDVQLAEDEDAAKVVLIKAANK